MFSARRIRILALAPLLALALFTVGTTRQAAPADAFETWCFDDPIIIVDGQLIDIRVNLPLANLLTMRSTTLTVVIPSNVKGAVVLDDVSAFPMKTVVSATGPKWSGKGNLPITVKAHVTSTKAFPIQVVATPLIGLNAPLLGLLSPLTGTTKATGTANTTLVMPMSLKR
jgi:hypothetical protein